MRVKAKLGKLILTVFVVQIGGHTSTLLAEPQWGLSVREQAIYRFNANRSPDQDAEIDEFQLSSQLAIDGNIGQIDSASAAINYRFEQTEYSKDTEDSDPRLQGRSEFSLGGDLSPYELVVSHERDQLLKSSSQEDLRSNQDDRDAFGVVLNVRSNRQKPGWVELSLSQQATQFDQFVLNDTTKSTVSLQLQRSISPLSRAGVGMEYSSVAYKYNSSADYDLKVIYGNFQRSLRRLNYSVAIGTSNVSSVIRDSSSPYLQASIESTSGGTNFLLNVSSVVVDNSSVNRLVVGTAFDESLASLNNGSLFLSDQIHRTAARFALINTTLCHRCEVNFAADYIANKYQNQKSEDLQNSSFNIGIRYLVSRKQSLTFQLRRSSFSYPNADRDSFVDSGGLVNWGYSIARNISLNATLTASDRNFSGAGSYLVKGVGFGFQYRSY